MPAARISPERPAQRPQHVHDIAGPQVREPVRAPAYDPVMDRDDPGDGVGGVDGERPPEHEPRQAPRPRVDELAGPRSGCELWRMERLQPLARQNLAGVDE